MVFAVTTRPPREDGATRVEIAQEKRLEPVGDVVERETDGKTFKLGRSLSQWSQDQVAEVIAQHLDAFAWFASDMPGIDPDFLCHRLAMDPRSDLSAREGENSMKKSVGSYEKRRRSY